MKLFICLYLDVDECSSNNSLSDCPIDANCTNLIGSYTCECNDGYIYNGTYCEGILLLNYYY